MTFLFSSDLFLSVAGIYLCGVVSGVSGLALLTFIYVGRGNQIYLSQTDDEEM